MYFNINCIGKLPGPTNEFERSLVFETGEFERPKFDCMIMQPEKIWQNKGYKGSTFHKFYEINLFQSYFPLV